MKNPVYLIPFLVLFSCGERYSTDHISANKMMVEEVDYESEAAPISAPESMSSQLLQKVEQKIIKSGEIGYEVNNYNKETERIKKLVEEFKGYISNENETSNEYKVGNTIEIRVPAKDFEELLQSISNGGQRLDYKRINAKDVTEEFIDLEVRLKTKREVEQRYLEILNKSKTIEDILKVEGQLRIIREEIEARQGRFNYLKNKIGLSTISLYFYENFDYEYVSEKRPNFFERIMKALHNGWRNLGDIVIGLLYLWPYLIVGALAVVLIKRYLRRRKKS